MPKYTVNLSEVPEGHELPPLLQKVGEWVGKQEHGTLGWFDGLVVEAVPKEWSPEKADRLRAAAFSFLSLADGSLLLLVKPGGKAPPAVALLGSEGETQTVANSLEEFLALWSQGETDIHDLDDEEAGAGREALAAWLKKHKVKAPKTAEFDFAAWLDGDEKPSAPRPSTSAPAFTPTDVMAKLGPKTRQVASVLGRRADAPEVITYVTEVLGKKLPASTSENKDSVNVSAPKQGIELVLSHDILHDAFPRVPKTARSFIPYISTAWVRSAVGEDVLGVPWKAKSEAEVTKVLGPPTGRKASFADEDELNVAFWLYPLDTEGLLELELEFDDGITVTLSVKGSGDLARYPDVTTGLFVGYAVTRGLLDTSRFPAHQALLAKIARREAQGSELVKQAMPRGLWTGHLRDEPALQTLLWRWFHNMNDLWIKKDLIQVFGKRSTESGHDAPKLADDTWDAVDKAAPVLDKRFAAFIRPQR
ncbi:hypothetical protein ACJ2CR_14370 [Myxococcus faecalis]|uniref:hypothetical protein n=1 Tax=Myxococcus faecalis TaxID=3115646 RepID=UPI0038D01CDB